MRTLMALLAMSCVPALAQPWKTVRAKRASFGARQAFQGIIDGFERDVVNGMLTAYGEKLTVAVQRGRIAVGGKAKRGPTRVAKIGKRAVLLSLHGTRLTWSHHWGATLKLGGKTFFIIDADGDGELFEVGEDALVGPDSLLAAPFKGQAWTAKGGWELRKTDKGVQVRALRLKVPAKYVPAFCEMNRLRQAGGSPPVAWAPGLYPGLVKHTAYAKATGTQGHFETKGTPGYSPEGHKAAKESVLGYANSDPVAAMHEQWRTAYHLSGVLSPRLSGTAMAINGNCFGCNIVAKLGGKLPSGAVKMIWPPPGMRRVWKAFNPTGENPMPVPGQETNYRLQVGQCVLVIVGDPSAKWSATMKVRGQAIECYTIRPGQMRAHRKDQLIITPKAHLPAGQRVDVELRRGGAVIRRWWFQTR